jgi:hypothetical protein
MGLKKEITREMLSHYLELSKKKKEIELELEELKKDFNDYFNESVGKNSKGELILKDYKLQRQIRKVEKYDREHTVKKLEEMNLANLIEKRPDEKKIKSAIHLGILKEEELKDCKTMNTSEAIYVKYLN